MMDQEQSTLSSISRAEKAINVHNGDSDGHRLVYNDEVSSEKISLTAAKAANTRKAALSTQLKQTQAQMNPPPTKELIQPDGTKQIVVDTERLASLMVLEQVLSSNISIARNEAKTAKNSAKSHKRKANSFKGKAQNSESKAGVQSGQKSMYEQNLAAIKQAQETMTGYDPETQAF